MSFKLNLKAKIRLDTLIKKLLSTIRDKPGRRWLDKGLVRELIEMTDFKQMKVRNLHLYLRPLGKENSVILVFDNELAIYHSTVEDIALRRSPYWQEVFSISNIKKIMNDKDVIISKGRESLERLHANALELLDLTCTRDDLMLLLEDGRNGLERKSVTQVRESLDLFVALLDFQLVSYRDLTQSLHIYAGIKSNGDNFNTFAPIILFDEKNLYLGMKKGPFRPHSDSELAWFIKYTMQKEEVDIKGIEVFKFLAELSAEKAKTGREKIDFEERVS
ncbi:MAG: hypothetical protein JXL81_08215 [Deltaproteobacteria bacterium]|nr:hypothetical protein [Deltaproteobacteria bacterium]